MMVMRSLYNNFVILGKVARIVVILLGVFHCLKASGIEWSDKHMEWYESNQDIQWTYWTFQENNHTYATLTLSNDWGYKSSIRVPQYVGDGEDRIEVREIWNGTFGWGGITEVVLPSSVERFGNWVFEGSSNLVSVTMPSRLSSMGTGTFYGCEKLKSIVMPSSLNVIPRRTFFGCHSLENVTLSSRLSEVGEEAFALCRSLTDISLGTSLKRIGKHAFGETGLQEVVVPSSVVELDAGAFYQCWYLTNAIIQAKISSVPRDLFSADRALQHVELPNTIKNIEESAFSCCKFKQIELPDGVTNIANQAFYWTGLRSLQVLPNIQSIGAEAFSKTLISDFTFGRDLKKIGKNALPETAKNVVFLGEKPEYVTEYPTSDIHTYVVKGNDSWTEDVASGVWNGAPIDYLSYCIKFDPNGGVGECAEMSKVCYGEIVSLKANQYCRPGYSFAGWDCHGRVYQDCDAVSNLTMVPNAEVSMIARWQPNRYSITYHSCGGTGDMLPTECLYGDAIELGTNTFVRLGYDIVGWATENGGDVVYADCEKVMNLVDEPEGVFDLYAVWGDKPVETPVITPPDGTAFNTRLCLISIETTSEAVDIYYTTNGRTPRATESCRYTGPFYINSTTTIKAFVARGTKQSGLVSAVITKDDRVRDPVISPEDGTVFKKIPCTVLITCPTDESDIYYTLDGTDPIVGMSNIYKGPLELYETTTIKAIAYRDGYSSGIVAATLTKGNLEPLTLVSVLDEEKLVYVGSGGDSPWLPIEDSDAKTGESLARSGRIGIEQESWLEATVYGSGVLSFWWKVSCEHDPYDTFTFDKVVFSVDGVVKHQADGVTDWVNYQVTIEGEGAHVIRWIYQSDDWEEPGFEDCAWVDSVTWSGAHCPLADPQLEDAVVGEDVTGLGHSVKVPATWVTEMLVARYGADCKERFVAQFGLDLAQALKKPTGKIDPNGRMMTVWDDYVAGTDPTDLESRLKASIEIVDGMVYVRWDPYLNDVSVSRCYRLWGCKLLDVGEWHHPVRGGDKFFKVEVSLPTDVDSDVPRGHDQE